MHVLLLFFFLQAHTVLFVFHPPPPRGQSVVFLSNSLVRPHTLCAYQQHWRVVYFTGYRRSESEYFHRIAHGFWGIS